MYNEKKKCWIAEPVDSGKLAWYSDPENSKSPEYMFIKADKMLEKTEIGEKNAESFNLMKKAADAGYADAAYAIAQMYTYGWSVAKSRKDAQKWLERAQKLGSDKASEEIKKRKKSRTVKITAICIAVILIAAAAVLLIVIGRKAANGQTEPTVSEEPGTTEDRNVEVIVSDDTELRTPEDTNSLAEDVTDILGEYDDEEVQKGEKSTNRIIVMFEGEKLDLSDFPAAKVISDSKGLVVLQFENKNDADKCLEKLKNTKGVISAEYDEYSTFAGKNTKSDILPASYKKYKSQYSGYEYYTWGAKEMELDKYAAWQRDEGNKNHVVVAVVDTGVLPNSDTENRILSGYHFVYGGDGKTDPDGHGTHVSGTIIDCTQGLNIDILPVGVIGPNGATQLEVGVAVKYAMDNGADVINMSLGGGCSNYLDTSIENAIAAGIPVIVSAGNGDENGISDDTALYCPSHIENCIVVAAIDSSETVTTFSNHGKSVDVCAPGYGVVSYYIDDDLLESLNGTSMAAPHISALVAIMKSYNQSASPAQIEKYIKYYCRYLGDELYYGKGVPKCGGLVEE